jgi:tRNA-specific 2-thiouridylase
MSKKGRVLLAMSGGLDSSVSAILLQEQGYEVVGITLKLWNYEDVCCTAQSVCGNDDAIADAKALSQRLGIPHYVLDYTKEFREVVIQNFIDEYLDGRTPNPCILCNIFLKWNSLIVKANELNCDWIATGHYAIVNQNKGRYFVSKAKDETKDQSYVLWGLSQEHLSRTLFPLGSYAKEEIRTMAKEMGFTHLASKRESYDICFIPDNDYRNFLQRYVPDLEQRCPQGNFIDVNGKAVGRHQGYPFYTIGQRKGLVVAFGVPKYVCKINPHTHEITLGDKADLLSDKLTVTHYNLSKYERLPKNFTAVTKIRYRDAGQLSQVVQGKNALTVTFQTSVSAITPGQSAVIYEGDDVVAGGIIAL